MLVTHDPLEALVLSDRLLVLEDGHIVQEGTPAQVASHPATEYVAKLVGLNLYSGLANGTEVRLNGGGTFVVPDHHQHMSVLVALRPSAVVVGTEPAISSARNRWPATIVGLTLLTDRVRLEFDGTPPAIVDVTPAAVADLDLKSGRHPAAVVEQVGLLVHLGADAVTAVLLDDAESPWDGRSSPRRG